MTLCDFFSNNLQFKIEFVNYARLRLSCHVDCNCIVMNWIECNHAAVSVRRLGLLNIDCHVIPSLLINNSKHFHSFPFVCFGRKKHHLLAFPNSITVGLHVTSSVNNACHVCVYVYLVCRSRRIESIETICNMSLYRVRKIRSNDHDEHVYLDVEM